MIDRRRLAGIFVVVLLLHAILIVWLPIPFEREAPVTVIDLVLQRSEPESIPPLPEPPDAPAPSIPDVEEPVDEPVDEPDPDAPEEQIVEEPPPEEPVPLNLEPLESWRYADLDEQDQMLHAFRPEFYEKLEQRRLEQTRLSLLTKRFFEREGLPPDLYNSAGVDPTHFKFEDGCFDLRQEMAGRLITGTGISQQWWRTECKEVRLSAFDQPLLEFDPVGRAIPP